MLNRNPLLNSLTILALAMCLLVLPRQATGSQTTEPPHPMRYPGTTSNNFKQNTNMPTTASAGPDQLVDGGVKVFLDASNSWPLDTSKNKTFWKQTHGPAVQLSDPQGVRPFFISPEVGPEGAALVFELCLETSKGIRAYDTCIVNVSWDNLPPTANAGESQTWPPGHKVFLDASGSRDADGEREDLRYLWRQTEGPRVILSEPSAVRPFFMAPFIFHPVEALTFELITTDKEGLKGSDTTIVNIAAEKTLLKADAGPNGRYDEGRSITLDASASFAQGERITQYFWTQLQGPPVTLSNPTSIRSHFMSPPVENLATSDMVFELTLVTESGRKATRKNKIRVDDNWLRPHSPDAVTIPAGNLSLGFEAAGEGRIVLLSRLPSERVESKRKIGIPYTFFDIEIRTFRPDAEVALKIYLPEAAPPGYQWLKSCQEKDGTLVPAEAEFNADRTVVTLRFRDGATLDEDGLKNSVILDLSGLGGPGALLPREKHVGHAVNIYGTAAGFSANHRVADKAERWFAKLARILPGNYGNLVTRKTGMQAQAIGISPSNIGWNWLALQFGPAFSLFALTAAGFVSIFLVKKVFQALIFKRPQH